MIPDQDARFDAALEECCRRVQRGEILEHCLADYPVEYHEELSRLVPLAGVLSQVRRDPSPEFQARLEQRLLAEVDKARKAQRVGLPTRIGRFFTSMPLMRLAVITLVVLVVFAGTGVGVIQASDNSLPDSPLYRVKTLREWAELMLAQNNGEAQVGVYARQIGARGRELELAVLTGKPRPVVNVLAVQLAFSTEKIVDQSLQLRARGKPEPADRASMMIRNMQRHVDRLMLHASPAVRPTLRRLRVLLDRQEQRLSGMGNEGARR